MDIGELLAEAGLGRDAQAALLQPVAEGGNEGRGPGLPARVALSGIEAAEVGFDGVELGDATQALGRRVGSEVERDIANGDPDIASGGILVGIRCWAFPVAQDQRGEDGLTLLDIRRRQDKLTVLRQAPPGRELVRLDIEPCRHAVDCRAGAQGLRDNLRLHLIRPAPMTGRADLDAQRFEKRARSTHCEPNSLSCDRDALALPGPPEKAGRRRRLRPMHAGRWISSMTTSPTASASAFSTWSTTSHVNAWLPSRTRRSRGAGWRVN